MATTKKIIFMNLKLIVGYLYYFKKRVDLCSLFFNLIFLIFFVIIYIENERRSNMDLVHAKERYKSIIGELILEQDFGLLRHAGGNFGGGFTDWRFS